MALFFNIKNALINGFISQIPDRNPTCTGTSVVAIAYDGGVAIATDRVVSYGKTARYKGIGRQYRVNNRCVISFGGDHADFQWLQNIIERRQEELKTCSRNLVLTPRMVHTFLTSFLYFRRSKMKPIWNTVIVVGMQPNVDKENKLEPFVGVITQRGVAYETYCCATGFAAMLLNQFVETNLKVKQNQLSRTEALDLLRKCMEVSFLKDCTADSEFDMSTVESNGVEMLKTEKAIGNWETAVHCGHYE